ncbi:MAG: sigma 54-interacting transcriptional regulator, partial [Desulfococcaceae bacterium]
MVAESPAMKTVMEMMLRVARSDDTTVLITGESGTGKELVARGIHLLSKRKNAHFHSVSAAAVPSALFESEFFGHKKGAFTGASADKTGWFEIAHNSTLFMDEICETAPELQVKLLRVLEERKIIRIGSHEEIPVNVRVIAATNQDMEDMVRQNRFRADLYHRLNTFRIHIPPLRERKEQGCSILFNSFITEDVYHIDTIIIKFICYIFYFVYSENIKSKA